MKSQDRFEVLLEDLHSKVGVLFEVVGTIAGDISVMKQDIAMLKEDVSELKFDMKLVKTVVQEHSYEIRELKASLA